MDETAAVKEEANAALREMKELADMAQERCIQLAMALHRLKAENAALRAELKTVKEPA